MEQLMPFDSSGFTGEFFEEQSQENGFTYWRASQLMAMLGYKSLPSFSKSINKAMTTCNTLNIPIIENFQQVLNEGGIIVDYKLSRFACYLTAMSADGKNPEVAHAQAYFAALAGAVSHYLEEAQKVERLVVREEVSERETSLHGVAKRAGVENYAFFQTAGYRGMYNMNIKRLKGMRGVPEKKSLLDFMGKDELAANLFRITQTELKIKNENVQGQSKLEATAENVGREVRNTIIKISGVAPENMTTQKDLGEIKKELKSKSKAIKQIDAGPERKRSRGYRQNWRHGKPLNTCSRKAISLQTLHPAQRPGTL
ncbi:MAG: damage-inducible protein [Prevotellaceae bacterium]|jgi:DNA-damage-inducible protein D|nr:damage-inducible protein [Prevotellaceae bacterium]